jgi:hypothetical protein
MLAKSSPFGTKVLAVQFEVATKQRIVLAALDAWSLSGCIWAALLDVSTGLEQELHDTDNQSSWRSTRSGLLPSFSKGACPGALDGKRRIAALVLDQPCRRRVLLGARPLDSSSLDDLPSWTETHRQWA